MPKKEVFKGFVGVVGLYYIVRGLCNTSPLVNLCVLGVGLVLFNQANEEQTASPQR